MPNTDNLCGWLKSPRRMGFQEIDIEVGYVPDDPDPDPPRSSAPSHPNPSYNREISCGFRIFPCTRHLSCFATLKWFMVFICVCVMAQGSAQVYFNRTAQLWKDEYGFSKDMTDWLIIGNALFHGIFTVFIVHASIKYHRMIWISASITLLAVTCFALLIPEIIHPLAVESGKTIKQHFEAKQLCAPHTNITEEAELAGQTTCWMSFFVMMLFEAILGSSTACLFVHAAVFIDDHETIENAIMLNGIFLAFKQLGPSIGALLTWLSVLTQGANIFGTPEWVGLIAILFIFGGLLGMYPKFLTENIRIKNSVCSADSMYNRKDLTAFLGRIFRNKVVLLNIFSAIFFWSAISNFSLMENKFNQAKFAYPDAGMFHDPMDYQVVVSVLKPVIIFMTVLFTASFISTYNIRAFILALWNGIVPAILVLIFLVYIYLGCDTPPLTEGESSIIENYCSWNCNCERSLFEPVCIAEFQKTFFSPCYAGCTGISYQEGFMTYINCTCVTPLHTPYIAFPGLCNMSRCYPEWLSHDLVQLVVTALAGTSLVSHIVVSLYCVHYTERCYALAMQMAAMGLVGFGPIRSVYEAVANAACRYFSPTGNCRLWDPIPLTRYVLTLTIMLLLLSSCCGLLMAVTIRQQTSHFRDFLGVPTRRRRRQSACFMAQRRIDLANPEEYDDDAEATQPPQTTPLVFVQVHTAKMPNTMDTIPEVTEEIDHIDEEIEEEQELTLFVPEQEDEEDDEEYDERTPFLKETAL